MLKVHQQIFSNFKCHKTILRNYLEKNILKVKNSIKSRVVK